MRKRYHFIRRTNDGNLMIAWTWAKKYLHEDEQWTFEITQATYKELYPIFDKGQKIQDKGWWLRFCNTNKIYYMEEKNDNNNSRNKTDARIRQR